MAHYTKKEIEDADKRFRINLINGITGIKPASLIGSISEIGETNLAIFSSVVHLGSSPALIGFMIRPTGEVPRHTYENIKSNGVYTINHINKTFTDRAHHTSAKFERGVSEFDRCQLKEEYISNHKAPFVKESNLKYALKFVDDIPIQANGTHMIVGEIIHLIVDDNCIDLNGNIDLEFSKSIGVSGLNQYYSFNKYKNLPYARPEELPDFNQKKRPDQVVFDEESQSYNSSLLPYGTNIGAPSIISDDIISWKSISINKFNHSFTNKIEQLKHTYNNLIEEYKTNDLLYKVKTNFEPVIGQVYHLYQSDRNDDLILSLIPPNSWNKQHLGSYMLNHEKVWEPLIDVEKGGQFLM